MKLCEILRDVPLSPEGDALAAEYGEREIAGITCDSRRVGPGWVFVCIRGVETDGHRYADQAEKAGAAAIVAEEPAGRAGRAARLLAPSTRKAWAQMCANWFGRPAERLRLIGITGTNGKTSVTYMLKAVLEGCGQKVGLIGTIQNMIGDRVLPSAHTTPDPYDLHSMFALMVAEGCSYAVMEVSSHALDQERVSGCTFETAVFTNLTQDHLDYHKTMENYLAAKKKLFRMCRRAVVNADDPWTEKLVEGLDCPAVTYSARRNEADYIAKNIRPRPDGVDFELVGGTQIGRVRLSVPGMFSVYNALAAAACGLTIGLPFDGLVEALCRARGVKGRAEIVPTGRDFTVVIDYAHTPDGLEKICKTMKECCRGRLVTLFGCGGDRDKGKRPKMAAAAAALSDLLVVTSDNPRSEDPEAIIADILTGLPKEGERPVPYVVIPNRVEAIHWAVRSAQPGDTLLLAGKGHETYQILKEEVIHLDEREVVADALRETAAR
ncbi:MAG TPA: UDP-N-acetylmuramoyl-L-alanyl-D-glutamate--2,6-diaminopimelate ligase [Firmicutes bacterium]|nr:UDP-N-acetylmuramoyl-L-alanyl-D-glutamate--2,6-diaminopimelate ligase [Bacillota bacterium]